MNAANPVSENIDRLRAPTLRVSAVVGAVIVGLALIDISLERTEQREIASQAVQAASMGDQLLRQGHAEDAVEAFRKAHSLERENVRYELGLVKALTSAGKLAEAQPLLNEILEQESNNGEANLIAARLAAKRGQISAADSYYHRAIYGEWNGDLAGHRIAARLELIDFLTRLGRQDEIQAETLLLQRAYSATRERPPNVGRSQ